MEAPRTRRHSGGDPPRRSRRRADAERSIEAILDAGLRRFLATPDASMTDIARTAGVSRVTLYAHFPSREKLLEALVDREVAQATAQLDADSHDPERPADEALSRTLRSSWQILDRVRGLRAATAHLLAEARVRQRHDRVLDRVRALVELGRRQGTFRTDLPADWLVTVVYSLQHATADEVNAGRLDHRDAADALVSTVLSALAPPRRQ